MEKVKKQTKREFTKEEIDLVTQLYEDGMNYSEIGKIVGRNQTSIRYKIKSLGIQQKEVKKSLWSIEHLRQYITDKNQAKKLTIGSNKLVTLRCESCGVIKEMMVQNFVMRGGMSCRCSKGISYGNLAFDCYQQVLELGFESEKCIDGLPNRRVDFVNFNTYQIVEVHGIQHYKDVFYDSYSHSIKQDKEKQDFANDPSNSYSLEVIDMRISTWEHFKESIENSIFPSITEEDEKKILELMERSKRYNVPLIKKLYLIEKKSTHQIAEMLGENYTTINSVLVRNGVELRDTNGKKMIRQIETGVIFPSMLSVENELGILASSLSRHLNGKTGHCGRLPNGDKMHWEFTEPDQQYLMSKLIETTKLYTNENPDLAIDLKCNDSCFGTEK